MVQSFILKPFNDGQIKVFVDGQIVLLPYWSWELIPKYSNIDDFKDRVAQSLESRIWEDSLVQAEEYNDLEKISELFRNLPTEFHVYCIDEYPESKEE